jgi:hypothetical protein
MSTSQERDFIHGIIRLKRPTIAIEVGVAFGGMACSIHSALSHNMSDTGVPAWYTGFDVWDTHGVHQQFQQMGSAEEVSAKLSDIGENFALVRINTQTEQQRFRDELAHRFTNGIDFAFIDGCHSYEGIKNDFFNIWPCMAPNGIVAFHDTAVIDGCREFIADLRIHNNGSYDISDYPYGSNERNCGVTVITKPGFGNVSIDEICGSPSAPEEIYNKEKIATPALDNWWQENLNLN